jgi:negative regulator of flagellin synthesis FlgM
VSTKIGDFDSRPVQISTGRTVKRSNDSSSSASASGSVAKGDTQITDSAKNLAELEQTVQAMPAVDAARVTDVSNRLANGSYEINAERIADKLLRSDQELGRLE